MCIRDRPNIVQEIAQYMDREMDTTKLDSEIAEIESKLKDLDKAENKQYEILSNIGIKYNNIRPEKIEENLDKINTQREEMLAQLENKQAQVEAVKLNKMDFEMIKELLVKFNDVYWAASKELRKRLVQSLVKEVKLIFGKKTAQSLKNKALCRSVYIGYTALFFKLKKFF